MCSTGPKISCFRSAMALTSKAWGWIRFVRVNATEPETPESIAPEATDAPARSGFDSKINRQPLLEIQFAYITYACISLRVRPANRKCRARVFTKYRDTISH